MTDRQWPPGPTLKDLIREMSVNVIAVPEPPTASRRPAMTTNKPEVVGTEPAGEGWEIEPEPLDAAIDAELAKVGAA